MADLLLIVLGACLVNNLVLDHLIGAAPAVALARRVEVAGTLALAAMVFTTLAAPAAVILDQYVLGPLGLPHLELLTLVLIIAAIAGSGGPLLARLNPLLGERFELLAPLMTVNCAALGTGLLALQSAHGIVAAVLFGLGTGAGFVLTTMLLAGLQERLLAADAPASLRGMPLLLLTLGLLSMAFTGFTGLAAP